MKLCTKCGREIGEMTIRCPFCGSSQAEVIITSAEIEIGMRDFLTMGSERGTPVWSGIIIFLVAMLCFIRGLVANDVGFYAISLLLASVLVIGILRNTNREYEMVWEAARKVIYIVGVATMGIYFVFVNVNYLYVSLGGFIISAGFFLLTTKGKRTKKYTIFEDKHLALCATIITVVLILLSQIL